MDIMNVFIGKYIERNRSQICFILNKISWIIKYSEWTMSMFVLVSFYRWWWRWCSSLETEWPNPKGSLSIRGDLFLAAKCWYTGKPKWPFNWCWMLLCRRSGGWTAGVFPYCLINGSKFTWQLNILIIYSSKETYEEWVWVAYIELTLVPCIFDQTSDR